MEIFFHHDEFLNGKFPQPFLFFPTPLPNQKIILKTPVHWYRYMPVNPITITTCKHWSKFVTCSPSHLDFGGVSLPQRHNYKVF